MGRRNASWAGFAQDRDHFYAKGVEENGGVRYDVNIRNVGDAPCGYLDGTLTLWPDTCDAVNGLVENGLRQHDVKRG